MKLSRQCSRRSILLMKNIVLHNMYLILRISEAGSGPEKYCQRLREEFRTLSWPCQNLQLSEILVGNRRGIMC